MPDIPSISTFDVESGTHVAEQVPPDESKFGRAWRDPEPDVPVLIPRQRDYDGMGHNVPGEGRSRSRWRPVLALFFMLVAVGAIVAFVSWGAELWGGKRVPNIVGMSEGNARMELENRGLQVEVTTEPVDDGVGFVVAVVPSVGERAELGSTVTIVVGSARVVPEVAGLSEADAKRELVAAGAIEMRTLYQAWDAPEGTVVAVEPPSGSPFTSHTVITLTIAQAFTVPDVSGLNRREAIEAIEAAGLVATIEEVAANGGAVGVATETEPPAGTKLEAGASVVVKVTAGTPTDYRHVAEYFGAAPSAIAGYMAAEGFTLSSAWLNDANEAQALYTSDGRGRLLFTSRPFSHVFDATRGDASNNVLGDSYGFVGVRWEVPYALLPEGALQLGDEAVSSLVATCGLSGQSDACNQDDIVVPAGTYKTGARFKCAYGEMNGLAWTVLVTTATPAHAAVTCAPRSLYDAYDLQQYGGRVCCLVAYADMYTDS